MRRRRVERTREKARHYRRSYPRRKTRTGGRDRARLCCALMGRGTSSMLMCVLLLSFAVSLFSFAISLLYSLFLLVYLSSFCLSCPPPISCLTITPTYLTFHSSTISNSFTPILPPFFLPPSHLSPPTLHPSPFPSCLLSLTLSTNLRSPAPSPTRNAQTADSLVLRTPRTQT